jgi:hypothetical protein
MPRGPFTTESKKSDLKAASSGRVLRRQEEAVILGKDGVEKQLPPDEAPRKGILPIRTSERRSSLPTLPKKKNQWSQFE